MLTTIKLQKEQGTTTELERVFFIWLNSDTLNFNWYTTAKIPYPFSSSTHKNNTRFADLLNDVASKADHVKMRTYFTRAVPSSPLSFPFLSPIFNHTQYMAATLLPSVGCPAPMVASYCQHLQSGPKQLAAFIKVILSLFVCVCVCVCLSLALLAVPMS